MKKFLFIFLILPLGVSAQYNLTLYHLHKTVPQANFLNPGLMPNGQINVGFPGLSNIHFSVSNSFSAQDLIEKRNGEHILKLDQLPDALGKQNYLHQSLRADPLYLSFWARKNFFSLHLAARESFTFGYPREFAEYLIEGNGGDNLGTSVGIDDLIFKGTSWMEIGFGYGRSMLNNKLTIGAKIKYLYGGFNASIDRGSEGYLSTDPETFAITLNVDNLTLNTAGLSAMEVDLFTEEEDADADEKMEIDEYLLNNENRGLALDIGGSFQLTPEIKLHGSIIDLGSIKWKTAVKNYTFSNASYTFEGINIKEADDFGEALLDTLENIFDPEITEVAYKEGLSSKYYAGADFKLGKKHTAGAMLYGQFIKGKMRSALNLHYNLQLGRVVNTVLSYNVMNRSANNLGAGLSLNLGFWQIYGVTDNIFSLMYPSKARHVDFRFGMNMTFGRKRHERILEGNPASRKKAKALEKEVESEE